MHTVGAIGHRVDVLVADVISNFNPKVVDVPSMKKILQRRIGRGLQHSDMIRFLLAKSDFARNVEAPVLHVNWKRVSVKR